MTSMQHRNNNTEATRVDWQSVLAENDPWLQAVVFARLGSRDAVDEVMQEVALAAVRQSAPLKDPTKVAPWLYRLAIRQTLIYRRKAGRRRKLTQNYADRYQPQEADERQYEPIDWLIAGERQKLVRDSLATLLPRDAEILLLKYTQDWSYRQIAQHLGVSESAVEARLHRARGRLRKCLAAACQIETT